MERKKEKSHHITPDTSIRVHSSTCTHTYTNHMHMHKPIFPSSQIHTIRDVLQCGTLMTGAVAQVETDPHLNAAIWTIQGIVARAFSFQFLPTHPPPVAFNGAMPVAFSLLRSCGPASVAPLSRRLLVFQGPGAYPGTYLGSGLGLFGSLGSDDGAGYVCGSAQLCFLSHPPRKNKLNPLFFPHHPPVT